MRDLTDTLLAEQGRQQLDRKPAPKIVLTHGETSYSYETQRILRIRQDELDNSQKATVVLQNADGALTDIDFKGYDAVIYDGLFTKAGKEQVANAPRKVIGQRFDSYPGNLICTLQLIGIPDRLREDKASDDYAHHWSSTKTTKDLITEIADGQPVEEELTEEQTEYDEYFDFDAMNVGAGFKVTIPDRTMTKLAFKLKKTGNPAGTNVTFYIRATDDDEILASKTFPISSIDTSPGWCEVTFDSPVTVNEEVHIYCEHTGSTGSNYISLLYNSYSVKANEYFMGVDADAGVLYWKRWDCAYRYKYTGAGIEVFDHCQAYEVVYGAGTGEGTLIHTYKPADSFTIREGETRLSKIDELLFHTDCQRIFKSDGKIHVFVPTTSGESYDSEYSLAAGHPFFSKALRKGLVVPNKVTVHSFRTDESQHTGSATSAASYALLAIEDSKMAHLESNEQATSMAQAIISRLEINAQQGGASVPINCGSELYDYVKATDKREDDYRVGNLGSLIKIYKAGLAGRQSDYHMSFRFGNVAIKRVAGTRPSMLKSVTAPREQSTEETALNWKAIKPLFETIEDNFEEIWAMFTDIVQVLSEYAATLGYLEGETPAGEQILEALLPYYTKEETDDAIADKEAFYPATHSDSGWYGYGDYATAKSINGDAAYISGRVPWKFKSILSAEVLFFPELTESEADIDVWTDYCAEGEASSTHGSVDDSSTYNLTSDKLFALDVSGLLTNLAAGDNFGIRIINNEIDNIFVLGFRLKYS